MLRAMQLVLVRRPSTRLTLFGATYYRAKARLADDMRVLARELGLEGRVEFLGPQPQRELVRHLCESSALVLPSRAESFGCVLVEALACGTPVVATRCGGPEDIVREDVGRLVAPGDERALATAIEEVLESREQFDPERLRAYALENFSWDRVAERVVSVYREALAGRV